MDLPYIEPRTVHFEPEVFYDVGILDFFGLSPRITEYLHWIKSKQWKVFSGAENIIHIAGFLRMTTKSYLPTRRTTLGYEKTERMMYVSRMDID